MGCWIEIDWRVNWFAQVKWIIEVKWLGSEQGYGAEICLFGEMEAEDQPPYLITIPPWIKDGDVPYCSNFAYMLWNHAVQVKSFHFSLEHIRMWHNHGWLTLISSPGIAYPNASILDIMHSMRQFRINSYFWNLSQKIKNIQIFPKLTGVCSLRFYLCHCEEIFQKFYLNNI